MKRIIFSLVFLFSYFLSGYQIIGAETTYKATDFLSKVTLGSTVKTETSNKTTDGGQTVTTTYQDGSTMTVTPNNPNPPITTWKLSNGSIYQTQAGTTDQYVRKQDVNWNDPSNFNLNDYQGVPVDENGPLPSSLQGQTQQPIKTPTEVSTLNTIVPPTMFKGQPLNNLINQLFYIGLIAAVILAIVMIIMGGVQYMTIDAIASKESGKNRVKAAMGGLLLAFSAILILNTINPGLTNLKIVFPQLMQIKTTAIQGSFGTLNSVNTSVTPGSEGSAQFKEVLNADKLNAMAKGVITINGKGYEFISGGSGKGYLPPGTYTVTMNMNEKNADGVYDGTRTTSGFVKDGVGFAFDLSDANDSRTGLDRSLLRIHPDGNNPGTNGCIGLQGNAAELSKFKTDLSNLIKANGGKYTLNVGK